MHGEHQLGLGLGAGQPGRERGRIDGTAPLGRAAPPRVVDHHEAHRARHHREEVLALAQLEPALAGQPQVGLVDQRAGRERRAPRRAPQLLPREPGELSVGHLDQPVEGPGLPRPVRRDQPGQAAIVVRGHAGAL